MVKYLKIDKQGQDGRRRQRSRASRHLLYFEAGNYYW